MTRRAAEPTYALQPFTFTHISITAGPLSPLHTSLLYRHAATHCRVCASSQDETYRLGVEASEAHLTEVDLDDMEHDEPGAFFIWPCRCSDRFVVRESHLEKQVDTFECDTCALKIRVLYDFAEEEDDEEQRQAEQAAAVEEGHGGDPEPEPEPAARVADRCDEELTLHL